MQILGSRDPRVRICYRYNPPTKGRVFIANSTKCLDAIAVAIARQGIALLTDTYIAPATPVRIEIGTSESAPLIEKAAEVVNSGKEQSGMWRHFCKWVRALTADEWIYQLRECKPTHG